MDDDHDDVKIIGASELRKLQRKLRNILFLGEKKKKRKSV